MEEGRAPRTAILSAMMRAAHLLVDGEPKIFSDPFAARMSGNRRRGRVELHRAIQRGIAQYVILGAGLDSFAYRSRNPAPPPLVTG